VRLETELEAPQLAPEDVLPVLVARAHAAEPDDEEAVVPRRVVAHVVVEQARDPRHLARPECLVAALREQPLAVRPRVVVLRVRLQRARDEVELVLRERAERVRRRRGARAQRGEEQPPVVPDLVVLQVLDRPLVHPRALGLERGAGRE
jgi:hypothetical protein